MIQLLIINFPTRKDKVTKKKSGRVSCPKIIKRKERDKLKEFILCFLPINSSKKNMQNNIDIMGVNKAFSIPIRLQYIFG